MTKKNWQAVTSVMSLTEGETGLLDSVQGSLQFSDAKMLMACPLKPISYLNDSALDTLARS